MDKNILFVIVGLSLSIIVFALTIYYRSGAF